MNPYSDHGGSSSAPSETARKIQENQEKVKEVTSIMRDNLQKVLDRDEKLSELDDMADNLQYGAVQFEQQAVRMRRKMWWRNMRLMLIMGGACFILLVILIAWASSS